jgi:hypothetical protein
VSDRCALERSYLPLLAAHSETEFAVSESRSRERKQVIWPGVRVFQIASGSGPSTSVPRSKIGVKVSEVGSISRAVIVIVESPWRRTATQ